MVDYAEVLQRDAEEREGKVQEEEMEQELDVNREAVDACKRPQPIGVHLHTAASLGWSAGIAPLH